MIVKFSLNGSTVFIDSNPGERLVHILRRRYGLLGSREGCLSGRCGSCTVLLNGTPVPSCVIPIFQVHDAEVTTIEGFREDEGYPDIERGFLEAGVTTCGYCDAGKILTAHAILSAFQRPSKEEIKEMYGGTVCRCTNIDDLVAGVKNAALIRRKRHHG